MLWLYLHPLQRMPMPKIMNIPFLNIAIQENHVWNIDSLMDHKNGSTNFQERIFFKPVVLNVGIASAG